jgi:hypothetical protein
VKGRVSCGVESTSSVYSPSMGRAHLKVSSFVERCTIVTMTFLDSEHIFSGNALLTNSTLRSF